MLTRHVVTGFTILAAAAAIAGCAGSGTSTAGDVASSVHGAGEGSAGLAIAGAPVQTPASTVITIGTPPTADLQRSVRAAYTVPSGAFLTSFDSVIARAVALSGYVASSSTQPARDGRIVSGAVTLAIPATSIATFLNGMPSTFVASSIDFSSVDHTAQFVDVTAELASAHAHLHALDTLLTNATSLSDITTLEQQIETVQVEIDTDQGTLNALTASVDMATATIALSERGAPRLVATAPSALSSGVSGGWHNAVAVTGVALDVLVTATPLLIVAAIGFSVWRWMPRFVRRAPRSSS
ncbi:MAG TPA: DUF4349 domain-containing protein [Candidatus Dormibacteraeota bacterium]